MPRGVPTIIVILVLFVAQHSEGQTPPEPKTPKTPKASKASRTTALFDGRSLKHWKVLDKIDFEKHGKIEVKDGAIELGKGKPATGLVYTGQPPRMDYEIAFEARRTEGDDFFCGLTFPYDKDYVTLICGGWGGKTTGLSNVDGDAAIENETASFHDFKQNRWYKIRLRVTRPRIEAWIDNEKIIDLETDGHKFSIWWEQEPARPLGFATWYAAASYRNINLTRLGPPAAGSAKSKPKSPKAQSPKANTPNGQKSDQ